MSEDSKVLTYMSGLIAGAALGAVAGLLLAPKAGKALRKDIQKIATDFVDDAQDLYTEGRKIVDRKLTALKALGDKIDEKKYLKVIAEVVEELKSDATVTSEASKKLTAMLKKDWTVVKDSVVLS